jgi:WD40 repeat protein
MSQLRKIHSCTGHRAALYALTEGRSPRHFLSAGGDGWIVEWDLDAPELGQLVAQVETQVFALLQLPEWQLTVAGNMQGGLHWIDRQAPDRGLNVQHHRKGVYELLALGEWLFSAGGDGLLTRWSLEQRRTVESFHLSNQALRCMALAPQRRCLAVGASDGNIYLLHADTLALQQTIPAAHAPSVFCLCWSPDERLLLSGGRDAMLRVWDAEEDMALQGEQAAHWFTLNHIVYAPDGRSFATASRDKTLKIWDAQRFTLLKVAETIRDQGHLNSVNRLRWTPEALLSASDDRSVIVWACEV